MYQANKGCDWLQLPVFQWNRRLGVCLYDQSKKSEIVSKFVLA